MVDGKPQIFAEGHFLDTYSALQVLQEYRGKNTRWECSIASEPFDRDRDVEYIGKNQKINVNRRDFIGPLAVVRRWSLQEGSFVNHGGDARNAVIIHARAVERKNLKMDPNLKKFIEEAGYDPEALTLDQMCIFEKSYALYQKRLEEKPAEAEEAAEESTEKPTDEQSEAEAEETDETEKKEEENTSDSSSEGAVESECGDPEDKQDQTKAKAKAQRVRAHSRTNSRASQMGKGQVRASMGSPNPLDVYSVAILRNLGISENQVKAAGFSNNAICEGLAKRFNGFSVKAMALEMIRQATGQIYQGTEDGFVEAFFRPQTVRANAYSTQNPLGILSNVLNIVYLQGIQRVEDAVSKISKRQDVKNFHDAKFTQYEVYGLPEETAEDGPLKHATIVGEDYDIAMTMTGSRLTLTRKALINDTVEGFVDIVMKQGIKHQRKRQRRGMRKLMDALTGDSTFSIANGNKITAALSIAGLDAASAALRLQTALGSDPDEKEALELDGKYLLIPPHLAGTANKLFQETNIIPGPDGSSSVFNNTFYKFQPIVSSYISSGFHTNGSNTGWFLLADPQELPILGETRLQGASEPHITQVQPPEGVIGASWATFFEYGFGILDHRAAVYSDGTT